MKFTEMVDSELKSHHIKFFASTSKGSGALGFQCWPIALPPLRQGHKTKFYVVGFQFRINHLRGFHQNPKYIFFGSTLYFQCQVGTSLNYFFR